MEQALERCAAEGYLDDEATARRFVSERQERSGIGRARLAAELRRRGAAPAATAAALAAVGEEDDLARARAAAAKWRRKGAGGPPALARHLDRKGFSRRAIVTVLEEAGTVEGADLLEAEPAAETD